MRRRRRRGGGTRVTGGTIIYAHVQEPPCIFGGWIQQAYISRQVLDGLVTEDQDGSVKPWLATSWDVSPDGRTYTFTLKDGVKFTDGTPLDAAAVAYNFDQLENNGVNGTAKVSIDPYYKSAEAIDATHVAIHLNKPYPPFLTLITQGYFGIQSPTALKTRSKEENCEKPIGSGAFTVEEWKHGQEVVFKKNPDYTSWPATAKHQGPAIVDEVHWKFVADGVSRYASLTTGQSDVVYEVPTVNWKDAAVEVRNTIRYITPGKPVSFYMNTKTGVFTDKLVRQAFAYGADRKAAVEAGFHGVIPYEGNPSVSQATPDYNAEAAKAYAYDPDKANELLDQAGWTEGRRRRPHQGRQAADASSSSTAPASSSPPRAPPSCRCSRSSGSRSASTSSSSRRRRPSCGAASTPTRRPSTPPRPTGPARARRSCGSSGGRPPTRRPNGNNRVVLQQRPARRR